MGPLRSPPDDRSIDERRTFGVVAIDKPPGPTSHQVSTWVGELLDASPAAHAGTLDPSVTGCLPVLVGTGTRLASALTAAPKTYVVVLELHAPVPKDFDAVLSSFEGPIYQKPPRKSAVSRRLRVRRIHSLEALEVEDRRALLHVTCESGTYIRKLCHDLGMALGTGAHMGDLRRTVSGPFDDGELVSLHDLADAVAWAADGEPEPLTTLLHPAERALEHVPTVTIATSAAEAVAEGAPVYAPGVLGWASDPVAADPADPPLVACATPTGAVVCLGRLVGDPSSRSGTVVDLERVLV